MKIGEAFYERIAKPIGMQDFQPGDVFYFGGPASIHSTYHFEITARDMARFGLLYLRHGRWKDQQIVPEAWVDKSSHASEMVRSNGFAEIANRGSISVDRAEFGHLLKLILDARPVNLLPICRLSYIVTATNNRGNRDVGVYPYLDDHSTKVFSTATIMAPIDGRYLRHQTRSL